MCTVQVDNGQVARAHQKIKSTRSFVFANHRVIVIARAQQRQGDQIDRTLYNSKYLWVPRLFIHQNAMKSAGAVPFSEPENRRSLLPLARRLPA